LFAADLIYAWGWRDDGVTLLWIAADEPGSAVLALGTLLRHFQGQRDAEGQYRVYARLHGLRMQDVGIANNFAYFAILTGNKTASLEQLVREDHERDPANRVYLATYAFWLCEANRAADALRLLQPVADGWQDSPPVAFAYGLALAGTGQKAEARKVLGSLNAGLQTTQEAALIKARLD
jgi:predicted Zn-dependent protease